MCERYVRESPQTCDSQFSAPPKCDSQKKELQFEQEPETIRDLCESIRANRAI